MVHLLARVRLRARWIREKSFEARAADRNGTEIPWPLSLDRSFPFNNPSIPKPPITPFKASNSEHTHTLVLLSAVCSTPSPLHTVWTLTGSKQTTTTPGQTRKMYKLSLKLTNPGCQGEGMAPASRPSESKRPAAAATQRSAMQRVWESGRAWNGPGKSQELLSVRRSLGSVASAATTLHAAGNPTTHHHSAAGPKRRSLAASAQKMQESWKLQPLWP